MNLFEKLREDVQKDTSPEVAIIGLKMVEGMRVAIYQPLIRVVFAYIVLAMIFTLEHLRGAPISPGVFSIGVVLFAFVSVGGSELDSYRINKMMYKKLRFEPQAVRIKRQHKSVFLLMTLSTLSELVSYSLLIPVAVTGTAALKGNTALGIALPAYVISASVLAYLSYKLISWIYLWLNVSDFLKYSNRLRSFILNMRFPFNLLAFIGSLTIPAWLANWVLVGKEVGFALTSDAIAQTGLLILVATTSLYALSAIWSFRIGPALFAVLPVRRGQVTWGARISATINLLELNLLNHTAAILVSSLALAPLLYALYEANPSILVFLGFNIYCSAHATLTVLAFSRDLGRSSLRLLRRAGAQYTVIIIAASNLALVLGYMAGLVARDLYLSPGRDLEEMPFPGILYALHNIAPQELPFAAQIEAAALTVLILLALSWVQIVISKKAWTEALMVVASSSLAAISPQVLPQIRLMLQKIISSDWTIIHQMPELLLALTIPAIKSFLGSEFAQVADPGVEEWARCTSCSEPLQIRDRFCRACGTEQSSAEEVSKSEPQ
tara:strand:+ start:51 stop:1706 length:1656 start_codon:yes stop_codon:yes gene_type:complete